MLRNTLKTLVNAWGATGNEQGVAEAVKTLLAGHVDSVRQDALGNLIVEKFGSEENGKRVMFSAHMDHIGLVVTDVEKEGFLRVTNVGGVGADVRTPRHVVFENGVEGVVTSQPVPEGDKPAPKFLFVDIGAESKDEALNMVNIGDVCVYAPDFFAMGQHKVTAPAMDDRCACALLCELLLYVDNPKNTIVGVFSTQEEVGLRGATVAAYSVNPDIGVALDVTAWGDTPETKIPAIKLGAGPAVKFMDRSMIATPFVREKMLEAAEMAGVPAQREVLPFGGTDGGAIQHARCGIPTGTLSIPCRYVHSACETIDMRDMEGALKLLLQFVEII